MRDPPLQRTCLFRNNKITNTSQFKDYEQYVLEGFVSFLLIFLVCTIHQMLGCQLHEFAHMKKQSYRHGERSTIIR